ncbi:MAG: 3-isopropylmalate dehydratase [Candidatus Omnitrophica bacterium CG07_land_8_20_14_0_80_42_15]|uniref:3-isopropylmalate dehydratase small subunit n=1 Tax=Candidatus Aquitaenariimonas noxiae TaxID=1974741 RepID=A0A2J0KV54_9BACT|nr:MAG: 3-isopropylmalate dehydratase [Candidatus Omnitrophica bacterium CG07_land_8_20_14_0_80_42_15]
MTTQNITGLARRLEPFDNINTDYVISGRYKFSIQDPKELAKHIFEDINPDFAKKFKNGDFVVGGYNFGCGSSREQAPQALKASGVSAVLAKDFARIFYRNAFNIGLLLIECDTDEIDEGDKLTLDMKKFKLKNVTRNMDVDIKPIPPLMQIFLKDGGAIGHFKKHGGFSRLDSTVNNS